MKKLFTFLLFSGLFVGVSNTVMAQEDYQALNLAISFGNNTKIKANYEIPVAKNITVAPAVIIPLDFDYIGLGVKADYYFDSLMNLPKPWDIWAGVDTSFNVGQDNDIFDINAHVGVEYKFNSTWGILGEFGGGSASFGGIGVGIHF
ncbi:hypothetical protein EC396_06740 [Lutibacter sp. HS1-25]|uniref:hypothetical protein n=1 Tax=Lutibacter sp. HS1-25 TaxID=2485000 RepID=UPI001011F9ED|nr:hypothetical protein [Lutibacter sp. HS1-25]RXP57646.1 hypothetical protein EC396_06740 [Lutibacter sp. HS1-25]